MAIRVTDEANGTVLGEIDDGWVLAPGGHPTLVQWITEGVPSIEGVSDANSVITEMPTVVQLADDDLLFNLAFLEACEEEGWVVDEISLQKSQIYYGPRGGMYDDPAHKIPHKKDAAVSGTPKLSDVMPADKAETFEEMAEVADKDDWRRWLSKYDVSETTADAILADLKGKAKEADRERAKKEWASIEANAFGGVDMAGGLVPAVTGKVPEGLHVAEGLEDAAVKLGGILEKYPATKQAMAHVKGIVKSTRKKSGHAANYNPSTGNIEINDLSQVSAGVILHEMGHAIESQLPIGWNSGNAWGPGAKAASQYAAQGDPNEQFAEAYVTMLAGDAMKFHEWAPQQARVVMDAIKTSKKAN